MYHLVISWPFILLIYLAYPHLVSRLVKLLRLSLNLRYSLPYCFHEEQYDTLEYSKVKCYNCDYVRLQNIYSIGHKKCQQAFMAPLPGKQLAKDIVDSLINSTSLSPLTLAGLPDAAQGGRPTPPGTQTC